MKLEVLTPAQSRELLSLATLRSRLGITDSSEDTQLAVWLRVASDAIEHDIGFDLPLQTYQAALAGRGRRTLALPRAPVDPLSVIARVRGEIVTDYVVSSIARGELYRLGGTWPCGSAPYWDADGVPTLEVDWRGGYVLEGWISDWAATTETDVGEWVRSTDPTATALRMEATAAVGTRLTGANEPDWSALDAGDTVVDGEVTWTARQVEELPEILGICAQLAVLHLREERSSGLSGWREGERSESYSAETSAEILPPEVRRTLSGWRRA